MKKTIFNVVLPAFILVSILFTGCVLTTTTTTFTSYVVFGSAQSGNCTGRGICSSSMVVDSTVPQAIAVTLKVNPADSNVLLLTFSLKELRAKQPGQLKYYLSDTSSSKPVAAASYMFEEQISLADSSLAYMKLQPHASIQPTSKSVLSINDDVVTNAITYSHK